MSRFERRRRWHRPPDNPEYLAYLKSPVWRALRERLWTERGKKCECCGDAKRLPDIRLHHKSYVRLYDELDSDLYVLCEDCHNGMHGNWGKVAKRGADAAIKKYSILVAFFRTPSERAG